MSQNTNNDKQNMLAKIDEINKVEGFDPYPLAIDIADLNSSESRKHLPVVVQIAWFRMKYPEGKIATTVERDQEYYVATSRVYPSYKDGSDAYLAEGTAARKYNAEMPSVNPREWAQTASVGIALRNAGFGLQFLLPVKTSNRVLCIQVTRIRKLLVKEWEHVMKWVRNTQYLSLLQRLRS